jgi:hypothetical protein
MVNITFTGVKCPIRLDHNMHLRFLHLDVSRGLESETGLALLLSQVTSVHIEEISLSVCHCPAFGYDIFHNRIPMEWRDVDAMLAQRQLSNLKSVSVRHARFNSHGPNTLYPFEWFFGRLPLCHKMSILRMCETTISGPYI